MSVKSFVPDLRCAANLFRVWRRHIGELICDIGPNRRQTPIHRFAALNQAWVDENMRGAWKDDEVYVSPTISIGLGKFDGLIGGKAWQHITTRLEQQDRRSGDRLAAFEDVLRALRFHTADSPEIIVEMKEIVVMRFGRRALGHGGDEIVSATAAYNVA